MKVPAVLVLLFAGAAFGSLEPSRHYLTPHSAPANRYIPPATPNNRYVPPATPVNRYIPPAAAPSAPQVVDARRSHPATSYGVPDYQRSAAQHGYHYQRQSEENYEPAKYQFNYQVNDGAGNDYGHHEQRDGSLTRGAYSVLMPDGRRQIVEYEADEAGYRPRISYEGTARAYDQTRVSQTAYPGAPY